MENSSRRPIYPSQPALHVSAVDELAHSGFELRVHRDGGVQHLGNRAARLGVRGGLLERGLVAAWDLHGHIEMHRRNRKAAAVLVERDGCRGADTFRCDAGLAQFGR